MYELDSYLGKQKGLPKSYKETFEESRQGASSYVVHPTEVRIVVNYKVKLNWNVNVPELVFQDGHYWTC